MLLFVIENRIKKLRYRFEYKSFCMFILRTISLQLYYVIVIILCIYLKYFINSNRTVRFKDVFRLDKNIKGQICLFS